MKNIIQKKWLRLMSSSNIMKLNFLYHKIFGEQDLGNIGFNFTNKPARAKIVQDIINIKNYKSYLEIGTFKDELFNEIICEKKVGVDPFSGGTIKKTSDEFFSSNDQKFDCIYIDGLHYYKQVKIDILNSISALNENGIILIDDYKHIRGATLAVNDFFKNKKIKISKVSKKGRPFYIIKKLR